MLVLWRDPVVLGGSAPSQPVSHSLGDPVSHPIAESVDQPVSHFVSYLIAFGSGKRLGNLRQPPAWGAATLCFHPHSFGLSCGIGPADPLT